MNRRSFLGAAALSGLALRAQEPGPQALYNKVVGNPNLKKFPKGENFCWHANYDLPRFVQSYKSTGDTAYLDAGVRFYEFPTGSTCIPTVPIRREKWNTSLRPITRVWYSTSRTYAG